MDCIDGLKVLKRGFNYSQDGPGNRLVYHLQGCNMRCPWCSNPESISTNETALKNNKPSFARLNVDTLIDESVSALPLFFDGGGVTLTGGEPTMQFDKIKLFLSLLKQKNINTAIETNASNPRLPELFEYTDTLIMDFKHYDDAIHTKFTGISNKQIIANMICASDRDVKPHIRTPLINGFNASLSDSDGFLSVYKSFDTRGFTFEFLKYHEYGKSKWDSIGRTYEIRGGFVKDGVLEEFERAYRENGLNIVRT